jgi:16S rRNA C967 or C1407 C5-methylase (RsmB/RsmF family)
MGRRFRKKGQPAKTDQWRGEYKEIPKENALLERYYNAIIPESEQAAFWSNIRTVLPATFRLVGSNDDSSMLSQFEAIPFVPNAYKLPTSRRELRKDEQYVKVHQWLLKATEAGAVCRQEAVSMLPPLCLKIDRPDLVMLDMCAAPGSKTGQLLEYLAEAGRVKGQPVTGMVIANDADKNRAFMLHHQVRRLHSPALLVTCNDASMYPRLYDGFSGDKILFDRVLCDVPCSGDGTLRKTPSIWSSWSPHQAFGLHSLQRRILKRGGGVGVEGN